MNTTVTPTGKFSETNDDLGLYEGLSALAQGAGGENVFVMFTPATVSADQILIMQADRFVVRLVPVSADAIGEHVPASAIATVRACHEFVAEHGPGLTLVYNEVDLDPGQDMTFVIRTGDGVIELVPVQTATLDVGSDVVFAAQIVRLDDDGALRLLRMGPGHGCWGDDDCRHTYPK